MKTKEQLAEEKKLAMSVRIKKLNLDVSGPRQAAKAVTSRQRVPFQNVNFVCSVIWNCQPNGKLRNWTFEAMTKIPTRFWMSRVPSKTVSGDFVHATVMIWAEMRATFALPAALGSTKSF